MTKQIIFHQIFVAKKENGHIDFLNAKETQFAFDNGLTASDFVDKKNAEQCEFFFFPRIKFINVLSTVDEITPEISELE